MKFKSAAVIAALVSIWMIVSGCGGFNNSNSTPGGYRSNDYNNSRYGNTTGSRYNDNRRENEAERDDKGKGDDRNKGDRAAALEAFTDGNYGGALQEYKRLLNDNPENGEYNVMAGLCVVLESRDYFKTFLPPNLNPYMGSTPIGLHEDFYYNPLAPEDGILLRVLAIPDFSKNEMLDAVPLQKGGEARGDDAANAEKRGGDPREATPEGMKDAPEVSKSTPPAEEVEVGQSEKVEPGKDTTSLEGDPSGTPEEKPGEATEPGTTPAPEQNQSEAGQDAQPEPPSGEQSEQQDKPVAKEVPAEPAQPKEQLKGPHNFGPDPFPRLVRRWKAAQINEDALLRNPQDFLRNIQPAVGKVGQAMTYLQAAGPELDKSRNFSIIVPLKSSDEKTFELKLTKDDIRGLEGSLKLLMALDSYAKPLLMSGHDLKLGSPLTDETDQDRDMVLSPAEYAPVIAGSPMFDNPLKDLPPEMPEEERQRIMEEMQKEQERLANDPELTARMAAETRERDGRTMLMLKEGSRMLGESMGSLLQGKKREATMLCQLRDETQRQVFGAEQERVERFFKLTNGDLSTVDFNGVVVAVNIEAVYGASLNPAEVYPSINLADGRIDEFQELSDPTFGGIFPDGLGSSGDLNRRLMLTGQVIDVKSGTPVPGAKVEVLGIEFTTDELGSFTTKDLSFASTINALLRINKDGFKDFQSFVSSQDRSLTVGLVPKK